MTEAEKRFYEPKQCEGMNLHLYFFLAFMVSLALEFFKIPDLPLWNALGCSIYILCFPVIAIYFDFKTMCKRRQIIKQFFPEDFWSEKT
ncbi:MAG: hypothetical protein NWE84_05790 [Candidatus Bathyarchaeota archaeon]|nr:hypothetical protein [Candidatus Bathyarchaeota archaeon]